MARIRPAPAASAPPPGPGRRERLLFLGLLLGVAVYWVLQFHPFVLPNNDYDSFEDVARASPPSSSRGASSACRCSRG